MQCMINSRVSLFGQDVFAPTSFTAMYVKQGDMVLCGLGARAQCANDDRTIPPVTKPRYIGLTVTGFKRALDIHLACVRK